MVEWIKINGEDHPFSFNYSAIKYVIQNTQHKVFIDVLQSMEYYDLLLWIGLKQGAKSEKQQFKLTKNDCEEFLNQDFGLINDLALKIQACMLPADQQVKTKVETTDEPEKKVKI